MNNYIHSSSFSKPEDRKHSLFAMVFAIVVYLFNLFGVESLKNKLIFGTGVMLLHSDSTPFSKIMKLPYFEVGYLGSRFFDMRNIFETLHLGSHRKHCNIVLVSQ